MKTLMKEGIYRIYISVFFGAIFIFLFLSVVTFKQINDLSDIQLKITNTYEIQQESQLLLTDLIDAENGQRGFLLTRDSSLLEPFYNADNKIKNHIQKLKNLTKDNPAQLRHMAALSSLNNWRLQYLQDILDDYAPLGQMTDYSLAKISESKKIMDSCRAQIAQIRKIEFDLLKERKRINNQQIQSTSIFALIAMLVSLLIILIAFYKIDFDLRRLRRILKELNISNEKLNIAQKAGNIGQWVWNITNETIIFSDQHYKQLGYESGEYQTLDDFFKLVHPEDVVLVERITNAIVKEELDEGIVYRMIKKDGSIIYLQSYYHFVEDENGDTLAVGVNNDVTKDVMHAQDLEMRNDSLIRANNELASFNYIASHDLQEPLRKIQMFISRIDSDEETIIAGRSANYFGKIKDAANRMQILINDLLAFSRLNKTDKIQENIDLDVMLENIQQEWSQTIEEKKAVIQIEELGNLVGVPFLIQTLFSNIIGNSLKYSLPDRLPIIKISKRTISSQEIAAYDEEDEIQFHEIKIEDNGIGFDNKFAEKIFQLFQRLHDKNSYAGTGIGLAICKKIVEAHNGFICAEGKPNIGAQFIIHLPVTSELTVTK